MPSEVIKKMLEVGAHFGHKTSNWNPKMKRFIFDAKSGIHIIDLRQTEGFLEKACQFLNDTVSRGGDILFVGTKRQAQDVVRNEAVRCKMFYVNHRWLGGTLTNYRTIKASIDHLKNMEKRRDEGGYEGLTKKEKIGIEVEIGKHLKVLGGIKDMSGVPKAVFVVDSEKERIAIKEANTLGIPVVALIDTNSNPDGIDYIIPANDDAIKSINFFVSAVADACLSGVSRRAQVLHEKMAKEETASKGELPAIREEIVKGRGRAYVSERERGEKKEEKFVPLRLQKKEKKDEKAENGGGEV